MSCSGRRDRGSCQRAWLATVLLSACGGSRPGVVSPPPVAETAPASPGGTSGPSTPGKGWSFEGGLEQWTVDAGVAQPVCEEVTSDRLTAAGGAPAVTLQPPGDYWRTPIDVGADGRCRVDTGAPQPIRTLLRSPPFLVDAAYLRFRVGGGGTPATAVSIETSEGITVPAFVEHGPGSLAMREVVWDLRPLHGSSVRLSILDDGTKRGGLLVDAFRFLPSDPGARPAPLWGFADLHAHAMSELGFGRNMFYGSIDGPIEAALGRCDAVHGVGGTGVGGRSGLLIALFERSPTGGPGHHTTGAPKFDGWPRWTTQAHQQMYVDWIRRAWQGGLRILVSHAVNNEELATSFKGVHPFDDQTVALAELDALKALAQRHSDFMAVASSPREAREIIASGRLALVLGVEVDAFGKCRQDDNCSEADVRQAIDELYEHGARHIFPIHLADNAFGGSAVYRTLFNQLNYFLRDSYQEVQHADGVDYSLQDPPQDLPDWVGNLGILKNLYGHSERPPSYAAIPGGHVNQRGLTALGTFAVNYMMSKGILVDIDHMSQNARRDSLAIANTRQTPVVMGHSWFRDLGYTSDETDDSQKLRNEMMKTSDEVEAVRALGGVVAPITNQGDIRRFAGSGVTTECAGSSSSWLQAYAYAVEHLGGEGVGFGTDFNGLAEEPLPRFGPSACLGRSKANGVADGRRREPGRSMDQTLRDDAERQEAGVSYATPLVNAQKSRFLFASPSKPYTSAEVVLWIALGAAESKQDPARLGLLGPDLENVKSIVAGMSDAVANGGNGSWRRAAFLVHSGATEPAEPALLRERYRQLVPIYQQWQRMESGNPAAPLERSQAGNRDFDYNLDGLAHYGLLPDFLQDVSNQLRRGSGSVKDLSALFRSAESYVVTWEHVVSRADPPVNGASSPR